jgi:hypothetical protein
MIKKKLIKKKQTTSGQTAHDAKPAEAQPQHKHTSNIAFLGVGKSEDEELFLKVAVGDKTALLNVDNLPDPRSGELKILTRLGEPLITQPSRTEFLGRVHDVARSKTSFEVALKTGHCKGEFVLPPGLDPRGPANVERYFDQRYAQYHRRLHPAGTVRGWLQLAELCRGKTRLIAGLCLSVSGAVCGAFGDEPPGVQVVSSGGLGGTTIGRVVGTVWGGDRNPARKIGCGVSCNNTGINFEVLGGAFNQMLLYLDDMHNAGEAELKALLNFMNGEGRGRSDRVGRVDFCTPTQCSANVSWVQIARELKRPYLIYPLVDRIMEFGLPAGWPYVFEGVRTKEEFRIYGNELRRLARTHFGWAGPEFARRLERWMKVDLRAVEAFVALRHEAYNAAAADIESACGRDVGRVSNRFATLYVAGCLAVRFQIFPFTEAEVLDGLLTCHRDHVAFVDEQLRIKPGSSPAIIRVQPAATTTREPTNSAAGVPVATPFDRLQEFINRNRTDFLDLDEPDLTSLRFKLHKRDRLHAMGTKDESALVYVREHEGRREYLFHRDQFTKIAGGARESLDLKKYVNRRRLIETTRRRGGRWVSYLVKRSLPDGDRPLFVVIRHAPKK